MEMEINIYIRRYSYLSILYIEFYEYYSIVQYSRYYIRLRNYALMGHVSYLITVSFMQ